MGGDKRRIEANSHHQSLLRRVFYSNPRNRVTWSYSLQKKIVAEGCRVSRYERVGGIVYYCTVGFFCFALYLDFMLSLFLKKLSEL